MMNQLIRQYRTQDFATFTEEALVDDDVPEVEIFDEENTPFSIHNFSEHVCQMMSSVKIVHLFSPLANSCIPFKLDPDKKYSTVGLDFVSPKSKIRVLQNDFQSNSHAIRQIKVEFKFSKKLTGYIWALLHNLPGCSRKEAILGKDFISQYITGINSRTRVMNIFSDQGIVIDLPFEDRRKVY